MQKRKVSHLVWLCMLSFVLGSVFCLAQRKIEHIHSDIFQRNQNYFNGNPFYSGNVKFQHEQNIMLADTVVLDEANNKLLALSHVKMTVGDSVTLTCYSMEYDGNIRKAFAKRNVVLKDRTQTLETQELIYDRNTNKAYFNTRSKIIQKGTEMYSNFGVYDLNTKSTYFDKSVDISTDKYDVDGTKLTFLNQTMVFEGPTTISDKANPKNRLYTEEGTFNDATGEAFLKKNSRIYSNGKILTGDNMYFNQKKEFGYARGNVELIDPEERRFLKGGYGEFYQLKDSAIVTEKPYAVKAFKKDSLYIAADTIIAKRDSAKLSTVDAFHQVRIYKSDIQAKCDSLNFKESIGQMHFYHDPVFWSSYRQITGDTIIAYSNVKKERLDSIHVRSHAFAISKTDSLTTSDFNQVKGRFMLGMIEEEELRYIKVEGNAESIVYVDDEDPKTKEINRIGINKSLCGIIEADFYERAVHIIECNIKGEGNLYPVDMLPVSNRYLKDFVWRGKERPRRWQDIFLEFPEESPNEFSPIDKSNETPTENSDNEEKVDTDVPDNTDTMEQENDQ